MLKIAHRGYSSKFGDNNLLSFKKAIEHHFDYIEMDIQLNKDNSLVIFHDVSYNQKRINDMNDNEIKENNILFLKDFFKEININHYKDLKLVFDLKNSENLSQIVYHFLIDNNINLDQIILASFNSLHLEHFMKFL